MPDPDDVIERVRRQQHTMKLGSAREPGHGPGQAVIVCPRCQATEGEPVTIDLSDTSFTALMDMDEALARSTRLAFEGGALATSAAQHNWQSQARWACAGIGHLLQTYLAPIHCICVHPVEDQMLVAQGITLARWQILEGMSSYKSNGLLLNLMASRIVTPAEIEQQGRKIKLNEDIQVLEIEQLAGRIGIDPASIRRTAGGKLVTCKLRLLRGAEHAGSTTAAQRLATAAMWHNMAALWLSEQSQSAALLQEQLGGPA